MTKIIVEGLSAVRVLMVTVTTTEAFVFDVFISREQWWEGVDVRDGWPLTSLVVRESRRIVPFKGHGS